MQIQFYVDCGFVHVQKLEEVILWRRKIIIELVVVVVTAADSDCDREWLIFVDKPQKTLGQKLWVIKAKYHFCIINSLVGANKCHISMWTRTHTLAENNKIHFTSVFMYILHNVSMCLFTLHKININVVNNIATNLYKHRLTLTRTHIQTHPQPILLTAFKWE